MDLRHTFLRAATAAVTAALVFTSAPVAGALAPATYDPNRDIPPAPATPGPPVPMRQTTVCATSAVVPDSQFDTIPANHVFGVDELHTHATGAGQRVAVIDSGVAPNVRLPRLIGGGDYITGGDGLSDCDHHGTLIAGLIAAQPAAGDGFVGVAPDAEILSIRQSSRAFGPENHEDRDVAASTVGTLAAAIRRAADEGATVINLSVTSCLPAASSTAMAPELMGALAYAALEKDAVIIASAGNLSDACTANPGPDPNKPADDRGWEKVASVSLPSYADQFVLSVGGTTLTGDAYINTMPGPWVDVAAPAINVVSLDPADADNGGLINAEITQDGPAPLSGTSFAAAYVSGLAALIRERHPDLTAEQVRNRIVNSTLSSAWSANNLTGYGQVNPIRALTGRVSHAAPQAQNIPDARLTQPWQPAPDSRGPRTVGMMFLGVLILLVIGLMLVKLTSRGDDKE